MLVKLTCARFVFGGLFLVHSILRVHVPKKFVDQPVPLVFAY